MRNMNFKQTIIACTAILLGFASCSKQEVETFTPGEETNMKLHISFSEQGTRASQDPNATENEVKVSSVDVFIFDKESQRLENRVKLTGKDISKENDDEYSSAATIRATVGEKLVGVGINLPGSFPSITSAGQLKQAWAAGLDNLVSAQNGIVMFSNKLEAPTLVPENSGDYASKNTISIQVKRAVAKVAVQDGGFESNLTVGTISNASFAMRNSNKQLFPLQVIEGSTIKDPNWLTSSYLSGDFENPGDYTEINAKANTDRLTWNTKYVPENTSEQALEKMSTYASIRVKFAPSVYTDGDGKIKVHENAVDDFWVVMLDGVIYYFDDQDEADAFAGKNSATVSETYASGYCYYNAFINSKKGSNVERNTFYNAKISLIVPPGSPTPEVQNPDDTVREPTNIKVSIDIEEWTYEEEEYPLS